MKCPCEECLKLIYCKTDPYKRGEACDDLYKYLGPNKITYIRHPYYFALMAKGVNYKVTLYNIKRLYQAMGRWRMGQHNEKPIFNMSRIRTVVENKVLLVNSMLLILWFTVRDKLK
jgi:hypothetical protein